MGSLGKSVIIITLLMAAAYLLTSCSLVNVKIPDTITVQMDQPMMSSRENGMISVVEAIEDAAEKTGVSAQYLKQVAVKESGLNPKAKNPRSSAKGLYQFINSTWIAVVKKHGKTYGVLVTDRLDIKKESLMAGAFTNDNRKYLESKLKREVTYKELYIAHFAGPSKALKIIRANGNTPSEKVFSARTLKANPFLRGKTMAEVRVKLTQGISN